MSFWRQPRGIPPLRPRPVGYLHATRIRWGMRLRNFWGRLLHKHPPWVEHTQVGPHGIALAGDEGNAGGAAGRELHEAAAYPKERA